MLPDILFRSVFWRGIYFVSVLLLNILISRHFGAEASGSIYYISNVFSFILLLGSLCLESGMGYFLSARKINATQLGIISMAWALVVMLMAYLSFNAWAGLLGDAFSRNELLLFSLCFISGNLLINYFIAIFYAQLNFRTPNIFLFASNLVLLCLLLSPVKQWAKMSDKTFLFLYYGFFLIQGVVLFLLFMIQYAKRQDFRFPGIEQVKALAAYSGMALLINVLTFLINRLDYYFVNRFCDAVALGNYIQVNKFAQMFYILPAILASALFPMTAGGMREEVNARLQLLSRTLLMIYLVAGLVAGGSGYWLFPWLLGKSFDQMFLPFLIALPGIIAFSVTHLLSAYYSGKKMLRANLVGNMIALCIIITGDVLLIPTGGIIAAAAVTSTAYISYLGYLMWLHHREYNSAASGFLIFTTQDFTSLKQWLREYIREKVHLNR